jgi:hypothetical protein
VSGWFRMLWEGALCTCVVCCEGELTLSASALWRGLPRAQAEERKRRKARKAAVKEAKPLWEEDGKVRLEVEGAGCWAKRSSLSWSQAGGRESRSPELSVPAGVRAKGRSTRAAAGRGPRAYRSARVHRPPHARVPRIHYTTLSLRLTMQPRVCLARGVCVCVHVQVRGLLDKYDEEEEEAGVVLGAGGGGGGSAEVARARRQEDMRKKLAEGAAGRRGAGAQGSAAFASETADRC